MRKSFILFISLMAILGTSNLSAEVVKISANKVIYDLFSEWTDNKNCYGIDNFNTINIHRGVVELLLICKALKKGGLSPDIELEVMPNYIRALSEASKANVTMPAETAWKNEVDESNFYISDPIFEVGTIELGVYALPTNLSIMKINSLDELKKYKAVSSDSWVVDWATLKAMDVKVYSVPKLDLMFKFIKAGRADFLLNEFSSEKDLSMEIEGIRLAPIPNIKVVLQESRHFIVSKKAPNAEKIFQALQKGLKELRLEGTILNYFEKSGIINSRVKHWKPIYP